MNPHEQRELDELKAAVVGKIEANSDVVLKSKAHGGIDWRVVGGKVEVTLKLNLR